MPGPETLFKKRIWRKCFPVNFAKFQRTTFSIEHLWQLLLNKRERGRLFLLILNHHFQLHQNLIGLFLTSFSIIKRYLVFLQSLITVKLYQTSKKRPIYLIHFLLPNVQLHLTLVCYLTLISLTLQLYRFCWDNPAFCYAVPLSRIESLCPGF